MQEGATAVNARKRKNDEQLTPSLTLKFSFVLGSFVRLLVAMSLQLMLVPGLGKEREHNANPFAISSVLLQRGKHFVGRAHPDLRTRFSEF